MASAYGRGKANKSSLIVMFSVLTLFFVYLANIVPVLRVVFYFISAVFILGILMEHKTAAALISFAVVLFLGFLIVPDKSGMLPYMFFFGHYGIFKYFVDEGTSGATNIVLKLVYFLVGAALIYFFGGGFMLAEMPFTPPVWLLAIVASVIFLLFDWLFSKLAAWYYSSVRIKLLGGRA